MSSVIGTISVAFDSSSFPSVVKDVIYYGADPTGVTDSTPAFAAAALAATAYSNVNDGKGVDVPKPLNCDVKVPAGTYKLVSKVKTQRRVTWHFEDAAIVDNSYMLDGVLRRASRTNSMHVGIGSDASTASFRANQPLLDANAEAYGIATQSQLSLYGPLQSVASFADNAGVTCTKLTGTTFTPTSVSFTSALDFDDFKLGSSLTVGDNANSITGFAQSWDSASKTIYVKGWYKYTAALNVTETPATGSVVKVNYFVKVWAHNANVVLPTGADTKQGVGFELGTDNRQGDVSEILDANGFYIWGYDAVNLGPNKSSTAFIARNDYFEGFASRGPKYGFRVLPALSSDRDLTAVGFSYEKESGTAFRSMVAGKVSFQVGYDGKMEIGRTDAAQSTIIDFHSSGIANDYDTRILATGGSATAGQGTMTYSAAAHVFNAPPNVPALYVGNAVWLSGAGAPNGVIAAPPGSLYTNTGGGVGTTLYVKESGSGATGWVAK